MREWSEFCQDTADTICEELAEGKSLIAICKSDEMPGRTTVYKWLNNNKDFANEYARAREGQGDYFAEQIISEIEAIEDPAITRVKVDSLKWLAGRLNHKAWGDKKVVEDGPDRAARKTADHERLARICELAAGHGSRIATGTPGDTAPQEGSDEFPILREGD